MYFLYTHYSSSITILVSFIVILIVVKIKWCNSISSQGFCIKLPWVDYVSNCLERKSMWQEGGNILFLLKAEKSLRFEFFSFFPFISSDNVVCRAFLSYNYAKTIKPKMYITIRFWDYVCDCMLMLQYEHKLNDNE